MYVTCATGLRKRGGYAVEPGALVVLNRFSRDPDEQNDLGFIEGFFAWR